MHPRHVTTALLFAGSLSGCASLGGSDSQRLLQSHLIPGMSSDEVVAVLRSHHYQCTGSRPMTCSKDVSHMGLFSCNEKINVVFDAETRTARQYVLPRKVCTGLGTLTMN